MLSPLSVTAMNTPNAARSALPAPSMIAITPAAMSAGLDLCTTPIAARAPHVP